MPPQPLVTVRDVQRETAAPIVVAVEEPHLLVAVREISSSAGRYIGVPRDVVIMKSKEFSMYTMIFL